MIRSVKFVSVLCLKEDERSVLDRLQKCGEMMLCDTQTSVRETAESAESLRRLELLRENIKPYAPKKPLFGEPPTVDRSEFETVSEKEKVSARATESALAEIAETESSIDKSKDLLARLAPWEDLSTAFEDLDKNAYVTLIPGTVREAGYDRFAKAAEENGVSVDVISRDSACAYVVAAAMKDDDVSWMGGAGFEKAALPQVSGTAKQNIESLKAELAQKEPRLQQLKDSLEQKLKEDHSADLLYEQTKAAIDRETAPVTKTADAVLIEGWVPEDRADRIEKAVKKATDVYSVEFRDPLPGETPPTVLGNNRIVSKFEGITNMFSIPHYGGIDPNPVMTPWYWIIFGLMMGDVGYGAMMLVLGLILKLVMKPKGAMADIFDVVIYSSVTSVIAGVLFGSYFGETWNPILFSPMEEPMNMLIFTLGVGVAHIFTGLITAMYYNVKAGKWLDAVADQLSWILAISGIAMLLIPSLSKVGVILAIIGAAIILLTAGRAKPTLFGKISGGLVGLYGITGYMSDILSYSRILALSLSTGVVGMVMNLLAGMVANSIPVLGYVFAFLIYAVGHVFNLALGLLSAYVHDCRLQYIEFYSKFYEGNGTLFNAFKLEPKTIKINNNTEEN